MVGCVRCMIFFDVGDRIGAFQSRGRLRNGRVVVDTTQRLRSRLSVQYENADGETYLSRPAHAEKPCIL